MAQRQSEAIVRKLDKLLNVFRKCDRDPNITMETRARLGFVVHNCCVIDAKLTFNHLVDIMEKEMYSSNLSIILVASASFALKYVPICDREKLTQWSIAPFLRHTAFDDADHLSHFTQFLQSGGASMIPCLEAIVNDLLLKATKDVSKPVSLLISASPERLSKPFWDWAGNRGVDATLIGMISNITIFADLTPPADEGFRKSIEEFCRAEIDSDNPQFLSVEPCLRTIKWMVRMKCVHPDGIVTKYSNTSLNAIVVEIWAEYAVYGDLAKVPMFRESDCKSVTNAQAQLVACASRNPRFNFAALRIENWLWDAISLEFGEGDGATKQLKGIVEMGLVELDALVEVADRLPTMYFVHALRYRNTNRDRLERIIRLVTEIPTTVLEQYLDDFFDFIQFCCNFSGVIGQLIVCIRNTYPMFHRHVRFLTERLIESVDYFDERDCSRKIAVITALMQFSKDKCDFLGVFDTIWEGFEMMELSLNLCKVIFEFFAKMEKKDISEGCQIEIATMASAAIAAGLVSEPPQFVVDGGSKCRSMFSKCRQFYSVVDSDLVCQPTYSIEESFSLTSVSLSLLDSLVVEPEKCWFFIFQNLYRILPVCPIETITLANNHVSFALNHGLQREVKLFAKAVKRFLLRDTNTTFVMLASVLQKKIINIANIDVGTPVPSQISQFSNNIDNLRISLKTGSVLMPLLLSHTNQLSLLYEDWAPPPDSNFIEGISSTIDACSNWRVEKVCRNFLRFFHGKETTPSRTDNWIYRDFSKTAPSQKLVFTGGTPTKSAIDCFREMYPVSGNTDTEVLLFVCKHYNHLNELVYFRTTIEKCLSECIANCDNLFKFMMLLIRLRIPFTISATECKGNPMLTALAVRRGTLIDDDYPVERLIYCSSNQGFKEEQEKLLKKLDSPLNNIRFIPKNALPDVTMFESPLASARRTLFFRMSMLVGQATFFKRVEDKICKLISTVDTTNPLVFRELLLFVVSLCLGYNQDLALAPFCTAFLQATLKNIKASSARFYQSYDQLSTIASQTPRDSRERATLKSLIVDSSFDSVKALGLDGLDTAFQSITVL